MKQFEVFRRADAKLAFPDNASTGSMLHKVVDDTYTSNMGAGMFRINGKSDRVVLPYDEVAICLEGTLRLTVNDVENVLQPGDFAWIPKGTEITFAGDDMVAFYGVYPADWRTRNAE